MVQGVGFRPYVYRLAESNALSGWVSNGDNGVEIHLEGPEPALEEFIRSLKASDPQPQASHALKLKAFRPRGSGALRFAKAGARARPPFEFHPTFQCVMLVSPSCSIQPTKRYHYPYINCTNCGPRYSVVQSLPYDRGNTTMQGWPLDDYCDRQYHDPANRRFHAQPVACPVCGPRYRLQVGNEAFHGDDASIRETANLLNAGAIVAVKGIGGYHLACDATNVSAVQALRERKYRKEKPFALMVRDVQAARGLVELSAEAESLLLSAARPIVLARARVSMPDVAPENGNLGVMLPYAPLHHLLFAAGAPEVMVLTSANRSSEPIAYKDEDARQRLTGIADAFLIGERPIARRVDDSIARAGVFGPVILRRSRGYAPSAVATIPIERPVLAVGADLKNTVTLVVDGQAFVSQHIGDLDQRECFEAFLETIQDLLSMYQVPWDGLLLAHDAHPQYFSSLYALERTGAELRSIQHHRAHVASVLAERGAWEKRVLGVSFDGTGYGDDGTIWGGELFVGSVLDGFERVAHLRPAALAGGDAAARDPVQAAAGFLSQSSVPADLTEDPFCFPERFKTASQMIRKGVRTFSTTSVGRLFDAAAALLGFARRATFEGQAAMWVENLARTASLAEPYSFPLIGRELDFRPLLEGLERDRRRGRNPGVCARAFQRGLAVGVWVAVKVLCRAHALDTVVFSGGVFQNELLLEDLKSLDEGGDLEIWTNRAVPPNDGGISLGQAALAAFSSERG